MFSLLASSRQINFWGMCDYKIVKPKTLFFSLTPNQQQSMVQVSGPGLEGEACTVVGFAGNRQEVTV